jgi:hypothetical protein
MLHGYTGLEIDTIMHDGIQYITMPKDYVISIDTIPKNRRNMVKSIITENIPFILSQIYSLESLNIYYSDCLQWLYHNNKLYLIDMDVSYQGVDRDHSNYDLLKNFLSAFNIDYSFISESLNYLDLFKDGITLDSKEIELYNKLNDETMIKNHVYYCRNQRHIQIKEKHIHIYGNTGNMIITETILSPETRKDWELLRIA